MAFVGYLYKFIFFAKTRQRLLFLAIVGLFISAFALLVLQCTMGGLQNSLMKRSKQITGYVTVTLNYREQEIALKAMKELQKLSSKVSLEYEIELLGRHYNYIAPLIVHALHPDFYIPLEHVSEFNDLVLTTGPDLNTDIGSEVKLISPSHVNPMLGDIPLYTMATVQRYVMTEVPEVDMAHAWTRLGLIQNLIRKRDVNTIRFYNKVDHNTVKTILNKFYQSEEYIYKTWEDVNSSLVWALNLETTVMVFLFIAMTFLVALTILSGLMIFFTKLRVDLSSFWIIGLSKRTLSKGALTFITSISIISILGGLLVGTLFLVLLDQYGMEILPEVFVDRKIPVLFSFKSYLISFGVPAIIALGFTIPSVKYFHKQSDLLELVRQVGN